MFFALTDDQREFGTAVTTYLAERFDLEAVRGVVEDPAGDGNPAALWKAAAEQGWLAVTVPEEHDGLGLGLIEAQVIARSLGAGVAPGPWRGTVLAAEAIRLAGSPEQQAAWLPKLASGEAVGAFSLRANRTAVEYAAVAFTAVDAGMALTVTRPGEVRIHCGRTPPGRPGQPIVSVAIRSRCASASPYWPTSRLARL